MSRRALALSLALHAGCVGLAGWSWQAAAERGGAGSLGVAVTLAPESAGALLPTADDAPSLPRMEVTPPTIEPVAIPPTVDPRANVITAVEALPRNVVAPPAPMAADHRVSREHTAPAGKRMQSSLVEHATGNGRGQGIAGDRSAASGVGAVGPGYVAPQFLMRYKPPYPPKARAQRLEGVVMLLVSVDPLGRVTHAELSHSCGHAELDQAALTAVRGWRFRPARQADQPIPATVEVPIRFSIAA